MQAYDKAYRQAINLGDNGHEVGSPKNTATLSHCWTMWTIPYMIKQGVEQTGWKDSSKNADFIKACGNMKIKAGPWAPQGDLVMREQDHQGFHDHYISEVTPDLKLKVLYANPQRKTDVQTGNGLAGQGLIPRP